jgi:hypothetical protein
MSINRSPHDIVHEPEEARSEGLAAKVGIESQRKQTLSNDECQSVDNGNEYEDLFQTDGWDIET